MSLRHSPDRKTDRKILQAVALAIRNLEAVTGTIVEYDIGKEDAQDLHYIMQRLWSILESNDYTIDIDTNRLRKAIQCRTVLEVPYHVPFIQRISYP